MNKIPLHQFFNRCLVRPLVGLVVACALAAPAFAGRSDNVIYTIDNATADNRVIVLGQKHDGSLSALGSISTLGLGTGAGLGSQGALTTSQNGRWLFAVSAGSNQITTFAIDGDKIEFAGTSASGGVRPMSVTAHGKLLYVLNAGGAGNITGFEIGHKGNLKPIAGSTQGLGGAATGPAEIKFTPDGEFLVVSEKTANQIAVYPVDDGVAQAPTLYPSSGAVPFGFDITQRGHIIVSEAPGGTVSSYVLRDPADTLELVTASLQTNQAAPCWVAVTPNGRYAYTGNAGTSTITGFAVAKDGTLARLAPNGVNASTGAGSHTIDLATSADGKYLYALANVGQTVTAFRIAGDGSLTPAGEVSGVPVSTVGLAAR